MTEKDFKGRLAVLPKC